MSESPSEESYDEESDHAEEHDADEKNNNSIKVEVQSVERSSTRGAAGAKKAPAKALDEEDFSDEEEQELERDEDDHVENDVESSEDEGEEISPAPANEATKHDNSPIILARKTNKEVPLKHPKYQIMVDQAIAALNDRKGSSVPAIKKYILSNFENVDEKRISFYVFKYIKNAVREGKLKQIKNSYKLNANEKKKLAKPNIVKKTKPKTATTKKMTATAKKTSADTLKKAAPKEKDPPKTAAKKTATKPLTKGAAKATEKPVRAASNAKSTGTKKMMAATSKSATKTTEAAAVASDSTKAPPKKVAKPTLKISPGTSRQSLSLVKKKPANKASNDKTEKVPTEKRAPRAARNSNKK